MVRCHDFSCPFDGEFDFIVCRGDHKALTVDHFDGDKGKIFSIGWLRRNVIKCLRVSSPNSLSPTRSYARLMSSSEPLSRMFSMFDKSWSVTSFSSCSLW